MGNGLSIPNPTGQELQFMPVEGSSVWVQKTLSGSEARVIEYASTDTRITHLHRLKIINHTDGSFELILIFPMSKATQFLEYSNISKEMIIDNSDEILQFHRTLSVAFCINVLNKLFSFDPYSVQLKLSMSSFLSQPVHYFSEIETLPNWIIVLIKEKEELLPILVNPHNTARLRHIFIGDSVICFSFSSKLNAMALSPFIEENENEFNVVCHISDVTLPSLAKRVATIDGYAPLSDLIKIVHAHLTTSPNHIQSDNDILPRGCYGALLGAIPQVRETLSSSIIAPALLQRDNLMEQSCLDARIFASVVPPLNEPKTMTSSPRKPRAAHNPLFQQSFFLPRKSGATLGKLNPGINTAELDELKQDENEEIKKVINPG